MEDSFTEITNESWFGRIGNSLKGIIIGLIIFVIAFPLLWWNEGRAVNTEKKINFAKDKVVAADAGNVDKANEGKLIHISGKAETDETLKDSVFGVSVKAIKLLRNVEMYQWEEEVEKQSKKKLGGGKETVKKYTYKKVWSSNLIDSSSFKKQIYTNSEGAEVSHKNPAVMQYKEQQQVADKVTVGKFTLSENLIKCINKSKKLVPEKVPAKFSGNIKLTGDFLYIGKDMSAPQIGDMKVTFAVVNPQDVSIIAKQTGAKLGPYHTPYGAYEQLSSGIVGVKVMIAAAKSSNKTLTWILRVVGFILMFAGLNMIFKPLSVVADVVPLIGDFVGMGTGIFAFLLSAVFSLLTIAIAWIFYRPVIGISLLVIVVALIVVLIKKKKKVAA